MSASLEKRSPNSRETCPVIIQENALMRARVRVYSTAPVRSSCGIRALSIQSLLAVLCVVLLPVVVLVPEVPTRLAIPKAEKLGVEKILEQEVLVLNTPPVSAPPIRTARVGVAVLPEPPSNVEAATETQTLQAAEDAKSTAVQVDEEHEPTHFVRGAVEGLSMSEGAGRIYGANRDSSDR
jgi:hypothetical protein